MYSAAVRTLRYSAVRGLAPASAIQKQQRGAVLLHAARTYVKKPTSFDPEKLTAKEIVPAMVQIWQDEQKDHKVESSQGRGESEPESVRAREEMKHYVTHRALTLSSTLDVGQLALIINLASKLGVEDSIFYRQAEEQLLAKLDAADRAFTNTHATPNAHGSEGIGHELSWVLYHLAGTDALSSEGLRDLTYMASQPHIVEDWKWDSLQNVSEAYSRPSTRQVTGRFQVLRSLHERLLSILPGLSRHDIESSQSTSVIDGDGLSSRRSAGIGQMVQMLADTNGPSSWRAAATAVLQWSCGKVAGMGINEVIDLLRVAEIVLLRDEEEMRQRLLDPGLTSRFRDASLVVITPSPSLESESRDQILRPPLSARDYRLRDWETLQDLRVSVALRFAPLLGDLRSDTVQQLLTVMGLQTEEVLSGLDNVHEVTEEILLDFREQAMQRMGTHPLGISYGVFDTVREGTGDALPNIVIKPGGSNKRHDFIRFVSRDEVEAEPEPVRRRIKQRKDLQKKNKE